MAVLTYRLNDLDNVVCEIVDNGEITHVVDQDKIAYGLTYLSKMHYKEIYDCIELGNYASFKNKDLSLKIENYSEVLGRIDEEVAYKIHKKIEDFKFRKDLPATIKLATGVLSLTVLTGFTTAYATQVFGEDEVIEPMAVESSLIEPEINEVVADAMPAPIDRSYIPTVTTVAGTELTATEEPVQSEPLFPAVTVTADNRIYFTGVKQTGITRNYTNYTYFYNQWINSTGQRAVADIWDTLGRPSNRGIATINGRYLVAVATTFGGVGDYIDIVLTNGEVIPCIIADAKSSNDRNYTPYGHRLGGGRIDGVEWESFGAKEDIDISGWAAVGIDYIQLYPGVNVYNQPIDIIDDTLELEWDEESLDILLDEEMSEDEILTEEVPSDYEEEILDESTEYAETDDIIIEYETQAQTGNAKVYIKQM